MKFTYEVNPQGLPLDEAMDEFCFERDPDPNEFVSMKVDADSSICITANKSGWIYLAKLCLEMAYCYEADPQYHQHRKSDLSIAMVNGDEKVTFFPAAQSDQGKPKRS